VVGGAGGTVVGGAVVVGGVVVAGDDRRAMAGGADCWITAGRVTEALSADGFGCVTTTARTTSSTTNTAPAIRASAVRVRALFSGVSR
jgi:hypothetical protein